MKLRELAVATTFLKQADSKCFNTTVWCIQEMYWYQLRGITTKDVEKIGIKLGEDKPYRLISKILWRHHPFNFDKYFSLNDFDRKKVILDTLHSELLEIADEHEIDKARLKAAYEYCLANNLENRWQLKDKYFRSPDRQHYGSVECHWQSDVFRAYGVISDKKKKETFRKLLFEVEAFWGEFIYCCKCGWDGDIFYLESGRGAMPDNCRDMRWTISSKQE
jgi:hypothetical protein